MLCKSCQYPLKQLSEPRCPECGRKFDPLDATTFDASLQRKWFSWRRFWVMGVLTYLGLVLVLLGIMLVILQARSPLLEPILWVVAAIWSVVFWPFAFPVVIIADIILRYVINDFRRVYGKPRPESSCDDPI